MQPPADAPAALASFHELMEFADENEPSVPDELTRYILRSVGVDLRDDRALRVVSMAARQFVASILYDVYLLREQKYKHMNQKQLKQLGLPTNVPMVLSTEDITEVLAEAGVHLKTQMYYMNSKDEAQS
jgi:hypothetical protein